MINANNYTCFETPPVTCKIADSLIDREVVIYSKNLCKQPLLPRQYIDLSEIVHVIVVIVTSVYLTLFEVSQIFSTEVFPERRLKPGKSAPFPWK